MAKKFNILIFDEQGFFFGSTQKLERQLAEILSREFNVFFAYGKDKDVKEAARMEKAGIKLIGFDFSFKQPREPYGLPGMQPDISEIIRRYNIHCAYLGVFSHYQFPINSIPAGIPLILVSPFGHFASNGNVYKVYVSGKANAERLIGRGIKNVQVFYNPLDDYPPEVLAKAPVGQTLIFGRIGRADDDIYDPIALRAFKKLEDMYGDSVKYIVVNAPPAWRRDAESLGLKHMEFRGVIADTLELAKFYGEIDVLAHARKDGETIGIAIAEAMLAGNPILTHKSHFHNDHFDILDSSYSLWAEADDVQQYFENMKWVVEHKNDLRAMGQLARKRALEIFGIERLAPKIIADFQQACRHYYNDTFWGKIKGRVILYWQNLKAMPFMAGKFITYNFPRTYKFLRKFYYE